MVILPDFVDFFLLFLGVWRSVPYFGPWRRSGTLLLHYEV
jgi:hypothetical protein